MRLLHLSDIHLVDNGGIIWNTDTLAHFNKAMEIIKSIDNVDAIVVSGDLSDDGSLWSYTYIDQAFKSLGIPTLCCPGNHDSLLMMCNDYKSQYFRTQQRNLIGGYKFLVLNSVIRNDVGPNRNKSYGMLSDETLAYVEAELKEDIETIIVLHHPPIEPGGWLNRNILENRDCLNALVSHYKNVRLVLYGHIHCHREYHIGNAVYNAAPSVGFGFDEKLPKFEISIGSEGFNLITLSEEIINIEYIKLT